MAEKGRPLLWWPRDFAADEHVIRMTLEEEGAYRRLLDHAWLHGSVPADLLTLSAICKNLPPARMKQVWVNLAPCFQPLEGQPDRLVNGKLERVRKEQERYLAQKSAAGQSSAQHRANAKATAVEVPLTSRCDSVATEAQPPTPTPTPTPKPTPKTQKTDLSDPLFDVAWSAYPKRPGHSKALARKAWAARTKEGVDPHLLLAGVQAYARYCRSTKTEPQFIKHASTFLGPDRHWEADWTPPAAAASRPAVYAPYHAKVRPAAPGLEEDGPTDPRVLALVRGLGAMP